MDGCSCMFISILAMLLGGFIVLGFLLYPKRLSKQRELGYELAEEIKEHKTTTRETQANEQPLANS